MKWEEQISKSIEYNAWYTAFDLFILEVGAQINC